MRVMFFVSRCLVNLTTEFHAVDIVQVEFPTVGNWGHC